MRFAPLALLAFAAGDVREEPYGGWDKAVVLEAGKAKAVAIPALGGRLLHWSLAGENVLFENPEYAGKTLSEATLAAIKAGYTGYNIDLGPELRGIPPHPKLWVGPWRWEKPALLSSEPDPAVGMQITKELRLDEKTGSLEIVQTMKNVSEKDQSYCLWDRTLCRSGGFVLVPLQKKSRFADGWAQRYGPGYTSEHPPLDQARVLDGILVVHAKSDKPAKLGADSDAGWIAYALGKLLFVKHYPYFPDGSYTDGGNSVEVYYDPKVAELEPISPEVKLKPGESYAFPERWTLTPLDREVTTFEEARALAARVPPSPFRK